MTGTYEYQIFIGCNDPQLHGELVSENDLKMVVAQFFERYKVDFSMLSAKGGYLYDNGEFTVEDSLCINIIGAQEKDVLRFTKTLSSYMNQEASLIVRTPVQIEFNGVVPQ